MMDIQPTTFFRSKVIAFRETHYYKKKNYMSMFGFLTRCQHWGRNSQIYGFLKAGRAKQREMPLKDALKVPIFGYQRRSNHPFDR